MASDGSIIIDTRIDTDGFQEAMQDMHQSFERLTSSAKKFGAVVAAAFAVDKIVDFGIESSKAARMASDALQGLKSILDGQGRSFSDAQKFIDEYISDGLVPMTNAVTAYKNLASRGYDDSQIQQTLIALKDASAYGRQASLSMGEAVQTATEGLKNENSVLVDNAGVTKNVAKMWEEYAASIGTTAKNLTQQQKIQAEVTGILNETRFQTGDAARVAGTLSGQLQQLSFNFNNLKVAVGNIVNPFVQTFLPVINAAVTAVTRLANAVANLVNTFFGTSINSFADTTAKLSTGYDSSADAAQSLAGETKDVADATKKAEKANKSYLSGLDEINKISSDTAGNTSGYNPGSGGAGAGTNTGAGVDFGSLEEGNVIVEQVDSSFTKLIEHLRQSIAPLSEEIKRFGSIAHGAFSWFFDNVLKPLASFTVNEVLPRFFQTLANVMAIVNNILIALQPLWQWFWTNILQPIAVWTGGVFLKIWDGINIALGKFAAWCAEHPQIIQNAAIIIGSFFAAFLIVGLIEKIFGVINTLYSFISMIQVLTTTMGFGNTMTTLFGNAIAWLKSPFGIAVIVIGALIAAGVLLWKNWDTVKEKAAQLRDWIAEKFENLKEKAVESFENMREWISEKVSYIKETAVTAFEELKKKVSGSVETLWLNIQKIWGWIKTKFQQFSQFLSGIFTKDWTEDFGDMGETINAWFDNIDEIFSGAKKTFSGLTTFISGVFAGDWSQAWQGIKDIFGGIWESLVGLVKIPINRIIGLMNSLIRTVNKMLSTIENVLRFDFTIPNPLGDGNVVDYHWKASLPRIKGTIPYLAQGAVIPPNAPFMAMLGDQRNGTNLEGPEDMFRQIVREEFSSAQSGGGQYRFTAQINRRTLFDEFIEEAKMRQMQTGRNPFEFG